MDGSKDQTGTPKAHDQLCGENGTTAYWLASAWPLDEIADEWDWLFEDQTPAERLGEVWLRPRWTTDAERADPDTLFDLFGDDFEHMDTSVTYDLAKPKSPGAHRYLTTEHAPRPDRSSEQSANKPASAATNQEER